MKTELICPECGVSKPIKMIEGEPCIEYPDRADDPADFPHPGFVSLHRWIRYQCLFGPHKNCPPDVPFFDIPDEFAPGLICSSNSFKPSYGRDPLRAKNTEEADFLLGRMNEIIEAEKEMIDKHPELRLIETSPPENDSRKYHRKMWETRIFDDVPRLCFKVYATRYLCERRGEGRRTYAWTETMAVDIPYVVLPLKQNVPWFSKAS